MKRFKILIPIVISFVAFSVLESKAQTNAPDGEYLSITKTYTLNPSGDWTFRYQHHLKFLTYYAINSLYGETFIVYNPDFQKLKINKAVTTMADGTIVPSPKNAFNEVLPRYSANFPVANILREMVVTHTGLERGAVTELDYEINTTAGFFPAMMGNELLQISSPVDDLKIIVKIPEGTVLNYKLLSIKSEPVVSHEKGFQVYTFFFKNLTALTHDDFQARDQRFIPRLIFSAGILMNGQLDAILEQPAFEYICEGNLKKTCDSLVKNYPDNFSRIMRAQEIVATELNYFAVPPSVMGFKFRTATDTWNSNGATETEKAILLAAILRACGFETDAVAVFPESFYDDLNSNLLAIEKLLVKVSAKGMDEMLISPLQSDAQDLKFSLGGKILIPLIPAKMIRSEKIKNSINEISLSGDLNLDFHGKINGNLALELTDALNPAFKLRKDKKYTDRLLSGAYSGADIKSSKIIRSESESTEAVFEIATSDTIKQEAGYYFWKVPVLSLGTDGWHMAELPTLRNTPLEIPALINECYSYKIKLPEGMKLVTPATELSLHQVKVGELKIRIKQEGDNLLITRSLKLNEPVIEPVNYGTFRDLINIWNEKKYREIILRK
jgi:hypothetical protein